MEVWNKGREFIRRLERKQQILLGDIRKTENQLAQMIQGIKQCYQDIADINERIKILTPDSIISREEIYKGIRKQGGLLMRRQSILHKVSQMEDEKYSLEQDLKQMHSILSHLDKMHYKLTCYFNALRRKHIICSDNNVENEIQEMVVYGRENI